MYKLVKAGFLIASVFFVVNVASAKATFTSGEKLEDGRNRYSQCGIVQGDSMNEILFMIDKQRHFKVKGIYHDPSSEKLNKTSVLMCAGR